MKKATNRLDKFFALHLQNDGRMNPEAPGLAVGDYIFSWHSNAAYRCIHPQLKTYLDTALRQWLQDEVLQSDFLEIDTLEQWGRITEAQALTAQAQARIAEAVSLQAEELAALQSVPISIAASWIVSWDLVPIAVQYQIQAQLTPDHPQVQQWIELGLPTVPSPLHTIDTRLFPEINWDFLADLKKTGLVLHADNYRGLQWLLNNGYKESIQTVYIDPPYNTGSKAFKYRDKLPHSVWGTMMSNRLSLAKELMTGDGVIFTSIDDHEMHRLKALQDELFFFKSNIIRFTGSVRNMVKGEVDTRHEYLLMFSRSEDFKVISQAREDYGIFENIDDDPNGEWSTQDLTVRTGGYEYEIPSLDFSKRFKRFWRYSEEKMKSQMGGHPEDTWEQIYHRAQSFKKNKRTLTVLNKIVFLGQNRIPNEKKYLTKVKDQSINSLWNELSSQKKSTSIFDNLFSTVRFNKPKSPDLIEKIMKISSKQSSNLVLDFFAGSGTTAHAVLSLNKEDGGHRQFILVEANDYVDTIIIPRIQKVAYSLDWKEGHPTNPAAGQSILVEYRTVR